MPDANDFSALDEQDVVAENEDTQEVEDLEEETVIMGDIDEDEQEEEFVDDEDEDEEETETEAQKEPEVAEPEPEKKVQTPEENAYYAEMRRQQQAAQRQMEIQQHLVQTPEYQLAQLLQQQYQMTPDQILSRLQQEQLAKEAEQLGVHPQQLAWQRQQEQQLAQQQQAMREYQQLLQVQQFMQRMEREGQELLNQYPQLTPNDLTDAVIYMYENQVGHLPLADVVKARYADRIYSVNQHQAKQQALAEVSGRTKQAIRPPQGKAPATGSALSPQEAYFAKQFGMTPEEYRKWQK